MRPDPILFGTGFAHWRAPRARGVALLSLARIIPGIAGKKRQKVREKDVTGLKCYDWLLPLLARLHDVGCLRASLGSLSEATEVFQPERLSDHRLHAHPHPPVGGPQADIEDVRDDLLLLHGLGGASSPTIPPVPYPAAPQHPLGDVRAPEQ